MMFNGVNGKSVIEILNETILEILKFKINKTYPKFKLKQGRNYRGPGPPGLLKNSLTVSHGPLTKGE